MPQGQGCPTGWGGGCVDATGTSVLLLTLQRRAPLERGGRGKVSKADTRTQD